GVSAERILEPNRNSGRPDLLGSGCSQDQVSEKSWPSGVGVTSIGTRGSRGALGALILTGSCVALWPIAHAATAKAAAAAPPAAVACQACHGATGAGMVEGERPRIAGESAYYLDKQLRDFASGSRESAIMSPIAKTLSDADRSKVVAYFA